MQARQHRLKRGLGLLIREVVVADASALLRYVEGISGESKYLNMGPGDFDWTQAEEEAFIRNCRATDNRLFLLGEIEGRIVALLSFVGGRRPRIRHAGEFSLSVRKSFWGLGIGSLMIDALLDWARGTGIVTKVNLRVRADNERAIRLYERKGFRHEGTNRRAILLDGTYYDHLCMGLDLPLGPQ